MFGGDTELTSTLVGKAEVDQQEENMDLRVKERN